MKTPIGSRNVADVHFMTLVSVTCAVIAIVALL